MAGPAGPRGSTQLGAVACTAHSCHCSMLTLTLGASSCCMQTSAGTGGAVSPDSKQEKSPSSSLLNASICLQSDQDCTELESLTQQGEKRRWLQDQPFSGVCCSNTVPKGSGQNCSLFQQLSSGFPHSCSELCCPGFEKQGLCTQTQEHTVKVNKMLLLDARMTSFLG